jgi:hypothetical protein
MTLALVAQVFLAWPEGAGMAATPDAVAEARSCLASHEPQKAAALLEEALVEAGAPDRATIVDLLRQSYRDSIALCEAAGKSREAAVYRENMAILDQAPTPPQSSPPAPTPTPVAAPADVPEPRKPLPIALPATASPSQAGGIEDKRLPRSLQPPDPRSLSEPPALVEPRALPSPTIEQSHLGAALRPNNPPQPAAAATAAAPAENDLLQADQLFTARKYDEAGQVYARLAGQNRLPAQRRQIWAYCRWVAVVAQINAHPRSDQEWDTIEKEIRSIQRLTPGNWYGEYLQNRVAEARRGGRSAGRPGRVVVRGSAPEEEDPGEAPRPVKRPSAPASVGGEEALGLPSLPASADAPGAANPEQDLALPRPDKPAPDAAVPSENATPSGAALGPVAADPPAAPAPVSWHVRDTANFSIYHTDAALAERVGKAAEAVRAQQAKRWGSNATRVSWSPRCDIYLYPTARQFAQMTGQPETSPGFSTMGMSGSRVTARRVNLRADHPQMLDAIMPHEVTHVVLADLFTQQQIPRWADEGMAVLAEPAAEQSNRCADLTGPLREGRIFKLSDLMAIDYPNAEAWSLYYAQSVSLTQFLVQLGTPQQFVSFVRGAQKIGIEASLKAAYKIDGFPDLEQRWQEFATRQAGELTASGREVSSTIEPTRRQ